MKKQLLMSILALAAGVAALPSSASALLVYQGSLSTPAGIDGTGDWDANFKIKWTIEEQSDPVWKWKYTYTFTKATSSTQFIAVSHFTLEKSPEATSTDFQFDSDSGDVEFGNKDGIASAIKLDYEDSVYSFYSKKDPVWGDFFVKGGNSQCCSPIKNTAFNSDFGDPDPTNGPQNGLLPKTGGGYIYKILRPDSVPHTPVIPEPHTAVLTGMGVFGYVYFRRRKRK